MKAPILMGDKTKTQQTTREAIIAAAGPMFAEAGYGRVAGKDICLKADTIPASINYHFGGMDQLYAQLIDIAKKRLLKLDDLRARLQAASSPEDRLRIYIGDIVSVLLSVPDERWVAQLGARELVSPTPFGKPLNESLQQIIHELRNIIRDLTGGTADDLLISRMTIHSFASGQWLLLVDRDLFGAVFPDISLTQDRHEAIAEHMFHFVLGGCRALMAMPRG